MILLSSLVIAQENKIDISILSEDNIIQPGETFQIKVALYDSNNKPINDEVSIVLKNFKEEITKETTIQSNSIEEIKLDENTLAGEAKIIAKYGDVESTETFFIEENKLIEFKIEGEKLIVMNTGNSIYNEKIYITIGDTTGTKTPSLNRGESTSYRLIAPEGVYNIKVTDGKTTLNREEVKLTGTGQVIGALDESVSQRSSITGGISPDKDSNIALMSYVKNSKFTYVFILAIFGAMILLAIERQYRKKSGKE